MTFAPWSIFAMKTKTGFAPVVYGSDLAAVAYRHPECPQERWDAVAPLIAAAPDLLAALEGFTAWLTAAPESYQAHFADRLTAARAAIAKAKGGAPCN